MSNLIFQMKQRVMKSSSLSVLDEDLIRELVTVAETAVKSHLANMNRAKKDEEIQVIEDTSRPVMTVLPLKLPKALQIRIVEQLKSKGKCFFKYGVKS